MDCKNCEEKQACVPFFEHENAMMHMNTVNRNMTIVIVTVCITFVFAIYIFVSGYTSRTKDWLNTLANMQKTTEVENGVHEQPDP